MSCNLLCSFLGADTTVDVSKLSEQIRQLMSVNSPNSSAVVTENNIRTNI